MNNPLVVTGGVVRRLKKKKVETNEKNQGMIEGEGDESGRHTYPGAHGENERREGQQVQ